jgi:hypothetical protein
VRGGHYEEEEGGERLTTEGNAETQTKGAARKGGEQMDRVYGLTCAWASSSAQSVAGKNKKNTPLPIGPPFPTSE